MQYYYCWTLFDQWSWDFKGTSTGSLKDNSLPFKNFEVTVKYLYWKTQYLNFKPFPLKVILNFEIAPEFPRILPYTFVLLVSNGGFVHFKFEFCSFSSFYQYPRPATSIENDSVAGVFQ